MDKFTASNGITVERNENGDVVTSLGADARSIFMKDGTARALDEFFRDEDDERLGRWRSPEDSRFVVYAGYSPGEEERFVRVVEENTGVSTVVYESQKDGVRGHNVARAYFDAHPEPKPWHEAAADEAWELTVNGDTGPFVTKLTPSGAIHFVAGNGSEFVAESPEIAAGHRIYPKEEA